MSEQLVEKIEQARATLIDAVMHLNEVKQVIESQGDEYGLLEGDDDLPTQIASLEEIAEILEEIQARIE